MPQSLLRGLSLLEVVDGHGPLTIAALTRRTGWDKASVSRTVASCVEEGWLARDEGLVTLGPRAALLGRTHPMRYLAEDAQHLVHAASGALGLPVQAYALAGGVVVTVASAAPPTFDMPAPGLVRIPLWATAGGKVIAAQLDPDALRSRLPDELPASLDLDDVLPDTDPDALRHGYARWSPDDAAPAAVPTTMAKDHADLERQLAAIRTSGSFTEHGEVGPTTACVAVTWTRPGLLGALACIGPAPEIDEHHPRITRTLRAAVHPGATRDDVLRAALEM